MPISPATLEAVARLVKADTGIVLDSRKSYLLESRLAGLVNATDAASIDALAVRASSDPQLQRQVVEALLTHESYFFRDEHYFDVLAQSVLPELIAKRADCRELYVWCGACAAGQEVYSVAMLLQERFATALAGWRVVFVASDYSRNMLARARAGAYSQAEVSRGLSPARLSRHFELRDGRWQIAPGLQSMIEFRELNLIAPWPLLPPMDIVLLRNVLIYMSDEAKQQILSRMAAAIRLDGYLVLGATETLYDTGTGFERASVGATSMYRPSQTDR